MIWDESRLGPCPSITVLVPEREIRLDAARLAVADTYEQFRNGTGEVAAAILAMAAVNLYGSEIIG